MLTNLHANPSGGSVSQRILGAHYTQLSEIALTARGAILIAEHSRPREFFDQSRGGRPGGGVSRGLVEAPALGKERRSAADRAGRPIPPNGGHAELCRCGGASGSGGREHLHRAPGHGAHPGAHARSTIRRFLAELSAACRAQSRVRRHRRCRRDHRDESARHRGRGFHPSAACR